MRSAPLFALAFVLAFAMGCSGPRLARSRTVACAPVRRAYTPRPVARVSTPSRTFRTRRYAGTVPPPPPPPALSDFRPATRTVSTPVRPTATYRTAPRSAAPAPRPVRRSVRRPARKRLPAPVVPSFSDKDCST